MESVNVRAVAEKLNLECLCTAVVQERLAQALDARRGLAGFGRSVLESRPHLFSSAPVFVTKDDARTMADLVAAIERVSGRQAWIEAALEQAPAIAKSDFGTQSVFMGYDFHLGPEGPRLIEINTNAGGAYLNLVMLEALDACCEDARLAMALHPDPGRLEAQFIAQFRSEMQAQKNGAPLTRVAIVDDEPETQYLLPEFELAKAAFERVGIKAVIADPSELQWQDGVLRHDGQAIDLVYDRLVDFGLTQERHGHLYQACLAGAAVFTPSPRQHALRANKTLLSLLCDAEALIAMGADASDAQAIAAHVPATLRVTPENAADLWASRKRWFFKPASGHAGKAAYRGDKITKRAWDDVLSKGDYVAQEVAMPSERGVMVDGVAARMKSDIRLYTYGGGVLLMAARLYQGQTTNFRTQGGGFAPVLVV